MAEKKKGRPQKVIEIETEINELRILAWLAHQIEVEHFTLIDVVERKENSSIVEIDEDASSALNYLVQKLYDKTTELELRCYDGAAS